MNIPAVKLLGAAVLVSTVVGVFSMASSETVHFYTLIHWPSAVVVLGGTLGLMLVWQPADGGRAALCAGLGGELLGVVMILTSDTSPAAMEPGISLAAVSLIYGLLLSELVFRPLRNHAARKHPAGRVSCPPVVGSFQGMTNGACDLPSR